MSTVAILKTLWTAPGTEMPWWAVLAKERRWISLEAFTKVKPVPGKSPIDQIYAPSPFLQMLKKAKTP